MLENIFSVLNVLLSSDLSSQAKDIESDTQGVHVSKFHYAFSKFHYAIFSLTVFFPLNNTVKVEVCVRR